MCQVKVWENFLSNKRLFCDKVLIKHRDLDVDLCRNDFQKDIDRIVFCSAFRRLSDKAQVDCLASNDYVRTRLTHSLEVASVSRSLGNAVRERLALKEFFNFSDVVYAASLVHDIGNPPFGHEGERAMSEWFVRQAQSGKIGVSDEVLNDYSNFDGNAQGFRVITQLQDNLFKGGLRLTYAVLSAFVKYPYGFLASKNYKYNNSVLGIFSSEMGIFNEIAESVGMALLSPQGGGCLLQSWACHPLNFLVEAADDICYHIVDIEDAFKQKKLSFKVARDILLSLVKIDVNFAGRDEDNQIIYLRSKAIENLVHSVVNEFVENHDLILLGQYNKKLCSQIPESKIISEVRSFSEKSVYPICGKDEKNIDKDLIIGKLMDFYLDVILNMGKDVSLLNGVFSNVNPEDHDDVIRSIFDYVSGMTDSFAIREFSKL